LVGLKKNPCFATMHNNSTGKFILKKMTNLKK